MITDNFQNFKTIIKQTEGCLLAIDYGLTNVGLAISDDKKSIAMPLNILKNDTNLLLNIIDIINNNKIVGIVSGWPLTLDGKSVHRIGDNILFLCGNIYKKTNLPILLFDESMSTKDALRQVYELNPKDGDKLIKKIGKGKDDHLAARFVLQKVLDSLDYL